MTNNFFAWLIGLFCVIGISFGQIMFKLSANGFKESGTIFDTKSIVVLVAALILYGVTTLGWVWVLSRIPLTKAYPLMSLAFFIVPLLSILFLKEVLTLKYFFGSFLIFVGIVIATLE